MMRIAPYLFVLLWSTGYIGSRLGAPFAEPLTFLALRFAIVIALLLPLLLVSRTPWPSPGAAARAAVAGILIHGVYLGGVFWAIKDGMPAAIDALIVCLQPLATAVLAASLLGERIGPRHVAGLALGLAGSVATLLPVTGRIGADVSPQQIAACLVSLAAITAGTLWQKARCTDIPLAQALLPQYAGALVLVAAGAFAFETRVVVWSPQFLFALAWLSIVLSLGAIGLLMLLIRDHAVASTSALFYLVPAVTAVMAWALFDEALSGVQMLGIASVCAGVALIATQDASKAGGR